MVFSSRYSQDSARTPSYSMVASLRRIRPSQCTLETKVAELSDNWKISREAGSLGRAMVRVFSTAVTGKLASGVLFVCAEFTLSCVSMIAPSSVPVEAGALGLLGFMELLLEAGLLSLLGLFPLPQALRVPSSRTAARTSASVFFIRRPSLIVIFFLNILPGEQRLQDIKRS